MKMESIKPRTRTYVKWKNIIGLFAFIIIVFIVITAASMISSMMRGDCVEKEYMKACFSVDRTTLPKHEVATITVDMTNKGKIPTSAAISLTISPNLLNMSPLSQEIGQMNPDDTVKRQFRIASKDEIGKFKVEVDINSDGRADKKLFLIVEQKS